VSTAISSPCDVKRVVVAKRHLHLHSL